MKVIICQQMSNEKTTGCLGYMVDSTTQSGDYDKPLQYKDPYETTSIMESKRFIFVAQITMN